MTKSFILVVLLLVTFIGFISSKAVLSPSLLKAMKLREAHKNTLMANNKMNIMIYFKKSVDFKKVLVDKKKMTTVFEMEDQNARGQKVIDLLKAQCDKSQKAIISQLKADKKKFRPYYISNSIAVDGADVSEVKKFQKSGEISFIQLNEAMKENNVLKTDPKALEPENNIQWVGGNDVWAKGFKGSGLVIGLIDTGVEYQHPALVTAYRGNTGNGQFNHNYNWLNPHDAADVVPRDSIGHGTHVTGTAVGGVDKAIGIAPEAKFIACKGIKDNNTGTVEGYIKCFQFFLAPTDLQGNNPRVDLRPHIASNSFACSECLVTDLLGSVAALKASGIAFVAAATNSGPGCSTIAGTPAIYEDSFTVGAQNVASNLIAAFSSRGPVTSDGSNRIKPNIVAPGVNIMSSIPGNQYRAASGTSQSTPLVSGAIALLWNAVPELSRNIDLSLKIITDNAQVVQTSECGTTSTTPNNVYGHGGLNILKAVEDAIENHQGGKCKQCLSNCKALPRRKRRKCLFKCKRGVCKACGKCKRKLRCFIISVWRRVRRCFRKCKWCRNKKKCIAKCNKKKAKFTKQIANRRAKCKKICDK